jgi:hypothetical protein
MKALKYLAVLFAFLGFLMVGCSDKTQSPVAPSDQSVQEQSSLEKCIITHFTETHYPVAILDPGSVRLVNGKWIMKKIEVKERLDASTPLGTGFMVHKLSGIMDYNTGEGPVWGTFEITPDVNTNGGVWEGTYTGWRSKKPGSDTLFTLPLKVVGHGKGGTLRGMKIFINDVITAWGTPPVGWYGGGEGFYKSR